MTRIEKAAIDYASRYKQWDQFIIAKDAFISGNNVRVLYTSEHLSELVEVEFPDGSHQLTMDLGLRNK